MAAPEPPARQGLVVRTGKDGSFSLWSEAFGEGFHSGRGALREARETFLNPSQLTRFPAGGTIQVLEVCVGTGCNLAVLLEACADRGLQLDWTGLEIDPEPLRLALSQQGFRAAWQPQTLQVLEQLLARAEWRAGVAAPAGEGSDGAGAVPAFPWTRAAASSPGVCTSPPACRARILWGDARQTLRQLQAEASEAFDLIWHDAFSPQRCPQLWSVELLAHLAGLLRPEGRWLSYCSAAAVREGLRLAGLQLAALQTPQTIKPHAPAWSGGTLASPGPLPASSLWRALSAMEQEHLACSAGEPYRDPTGLATAADILAARQQAQSEALASGSRLSSSAWRRRWGVER